MELLDEYQPWNVYPLEAVALNVTLDPDVTYIVLLVPEDPEG